MWWLALWQFGGGFLHGKLQSEAKKAVHTADTAVVLFVAPSIGLHKRPVIVVFFLLLSLFIVFAYFGIMQLAPWDHSDEFVTHFEARHVRLTLLQTRAAWHGGAAGDLSDAQARLNGSPAGLKDFVLRRDSCELAHAGALLSGNATTLYLSFPERVWATGWMLTTRNEEGSEASDPLRFHIHTSKGPSVLSGGSGGGSGGGGFTLVDCLGASGAETGGEAAQGQGELEVREAVLQQMSVGGTGWCRGSRCANMTDEELLDLCLPAYKLRQEDWELTSASVWTWPPAELGGARPKNATLLPGLPMPSLLHDDTRGRTHGGDMAQPLTLTMAYSWRNSMLLGCIFFELLFAAAGWTAGAHAALSLALVLSGAMQVGEAISCLYRGDWLAGLYWWTSVLMDAMLGFVTYFFEHNLKYVPPLHFAALTAAYNLFALFGSSGARPGVQGLSTFFLLMWGWYMTARQWVLRQSVALIKKDMSTYDGAWQALQSRDLERAALASLNAAIAELQECCGLDKLARPTQVHLSTDELDNKLSLMNTALPMAALRAPRRRREGLEFVSDESLKTSLMQHACLQALTTSFPRPLGCLGLARHLQAPRIESLDLLYAQATVLDPIFQHKVRDIALASRGMFRMLHTSTGANDDDDNDSDLFVSAQAWECKGTLKRVDRIIEKVVRSYRGDVSRLCDIVRQVAAARCSSRMRCCAAMISAHSLF